MVQVPSLASEVGSVDDVLLIQTEHVTVTNASLLVPLLPVVCHFISDDLTHILDDYLLHLEILSRKKSDPMNSTRTHFHLLRVEHSLSVLHGDGQIRLILVVQKA